MRKLRIAFYKAEYGSLSDKLINKGSGNLGATKLTRLNAGLKYKQEIDIYGRVAYGW